MPPDDREPARPTVQPQRLDAGAAQAAGREAALRQDPIVEYEILRDPHVGAALTSATLGVGLGMAGVAGPTLLESAELGAAVGVLGHLGAGPVNCSDIDREISDREVAADVLQDEMDRRKEQIQHEYARRDALVAELRVIEAERVQAQQQDAARALDTRTLGAVRTHYNRVREALVTQAQATALMAETAFNYEHDADLHVVQATYLDAGRKGYGAGESLGRDLEALDHFHLTTHRVKRQ